MPGRVEGKVAFITGAARGQGRSHAVRLAEEGADIIAIDVCRQIEGVPIPMFTPEDLDEGVAEFGRLDIVVANAGLAAAGDALHKMDEKLLRSSIDVNLTGVYLTAKVSVQHIIEGGRGGAIVLTSSVGGLKAHPNVGNYIAGKHGVVGVMRTLAVELAEHSIRVNSVHPTQVNTPC